MPNYLSTDEIRSRWTAFFVQAGHKPVPSDSLVPRNDPSVLFTGAGMNQFKEHFLGRAKLDHPQQRAVTVQKCIRTADIDNVGRTPNHHTFFEMLGNFSFGDYFKKEAVQWAWEFCTDAARGLGLEKKRLSVTIFGGDAKLGLEKDTEAEQWWQKSAPELRNSDGSWRIYCYGEHDNFWPADAPSLGPNGPCGPCSEIYYDTKPEQGAPERVAESKDPTRYVEIWNLVFTQFNRLDVGKLEPLSQKNIDTGAGLERIARVMQVKANNYEIDLLFPIVQAVAGIAGKKYGADFDDGRRMRRITDHVRAAVFCIADGVAPKNEGRNYVVRRLMRRAILDGQDLGIKEPFLGGVAKTVIKQMSVGYPELAPRTQTLVRLIEEEEAAFDRTLVQGRQQFNQIVEALKAQKRPVVAGASAFKLWDTFGFPIELTTELAEAQGLEVEIEAFKQEMEEAARRSQAGSAMSKEIFASGPVAELKKKFAGQSTVFRGYEELRLDGAKVLALIQGEKLTDQAGPGEALVLLDATPFYAESGGQVGDKGWLVVQASCLPSSQEQAGSPHHKEQAESLRYSVLDVHKQEGLFLHQVKLNGALRVGEQVAAEVDPDHRAPTIRNHSATHLLHKALRAVLGTHVEQRGSLVAPERLRFDFTHFEQIKPAQLAEIEARVNAMICSDDKVEAVEMPLAEARAKGAMALFGEKYGERVRMVTMGSSMELCGGTHCCSTGQIGYFRIVSEGSIAAGVRRIEALTGAAAVAEARRAEELLGELSLLLKTKKEAVRERIAALQEQNTALERQLEAQRKRAAAETAGELLGNVKEVAGVKVLAAALDGLEMAGLRTMLDGIRKTLKEGVVVLGGVKDGKVALLVNLSPDVVKRGGHAGNILKELAPKVGGKGGGKAEIAQGGGTDASKLPEALAGVTGLLLNMLGK